MKRFVLIFALALIPLCHSAKAGYIASTAASCGSPTGLGVGCTTSAVNATGATMLKCISVDFSGSFTDVVTDAGGNAWHVIDNIAIGNTLGTSWYAYSKSGGALSVGASETFTVANGNYVSLNCAAYNGTATGASNPLDQHAAGTATGTSVFPGSITPLQDNEVVVSDYGAFLVGTISINSSFAITGSINGDQTTHMTAAEAYIVQTMATAVNPTWSTTSASDSLVAFSASFSTSATMCVSVQDGGLTQPATWGGGGSGCTGAGGIPGTGDVAEIANNVTIDGSITIKSCVVGTGGKLLTDGVSQHTITLTTSTSPGCDFNPGSGTGVTVLDTSAGSAGKEVIFSCTSLTDGSCLHSADTNASVTIKAEHLEVLTTNGGVTQIYDSDPLETGTFIGTNILLNGAGGAPGAGTNNGIFLNGVANVTVDKVTWPGGAGILLNMYGAGPTSCSISNPTAYDITGNMTVLYSTSGDLSNCGTISGISGNGDVAGTYTVTGFTGQTTPLSHPLIIQNTSVHCYGSAPAFGCLVIGSTPGTTSNHFTARYNVGDNTNIAIYNPTGVPYVDQINNYSWRSGAVNDGQWSYGVYGDDHVTSSGDIAVIQTSGESSGFYDIGSGGGVANMTITHGTVVSTSATGAGGTFPGVGFGEPGVEATAPSGISYSCVVNQYAGISSPLTGNVFSNNLVSNTVGVAFNNVVGSGSGGPYIRTGTSQYFWNAVTDHPSFIVYGDIAINPYLYEVARECPRVDELIGHLSAGSGTCEHLYTQLGNQWNGSNGAYTPQLDYLYSYYSAVPQNGAVGNPSTYMCSAVPQLLGASGMRRGR